MSKKKYDCELNDSIFLTDKEFIEKYKVSKSTMYSNIFSSGENKEHILDTIRIALTAKNLLLTNTYFHQIVELLVNSNDDKYIKSFENIFTELLDILKYSELASKIKGK